MVCIFHSQKDHFPSTKNEPQCNHRNESNNYSCHWEKVNHFKDIFFQEIILYKEKHCHICHTPITFYLPISIVWQIIYHSSYTSATCAFYWTTSPNALKKGTNYIYWFPIRKISKKMNKQTDKFSSSLQSRALFTVVESYLHSSEEHSSLESNHKKMSTLKHIYTVFPVCLYSSLQKSGNQQNST